MVREKVKRAVWWYWFDRGQSWTRVKDLVDLGLGCGLFVIWAQSVDQASVGLVNCDPVLVFNRN